MEIEHIEAFCAVAEAGGFTRASRSLGVEKAAVSKIVKKLEGELGIRLFERSTRTVRLTEAGAAFLARGKLLVEESRKLIEDVRGLKREVRGELRIAATVDLGVTLCRTVLPKFVAANPEVKISMSLSYEYSDLFAEKIDVALRIGHPNSSNLMAIKIGASPRGLFASSRYLKAHGKLRHPRDLASHSLLAFRTYEREETSWVLEREGEKLEVPLVGSLSVQNFQVLCEAAGAGMGVTMLPELFYEHQIRAARLVRVLPEWKLPTGEIFAVYPSRELKPAKLEAFLEHLKRSFPQNG